MGTRTLAQPSILIVEDNEFMRRMSRRHLEEAGFRVIEAENGAMGIRYASDYTPNLILCDLRMPDIEGYDVLRAVRAEKATALTPFIFLTSTHDPVARRRGMELGADDFLTKPVHYKDLLFAIHSQLEKYDHMFRVYHDQREALRQTQRQLSLMVAHELRTPLVSIKMAHDIMRWKLEQLSQEDMAELLLTMDGGIRRLRHLVEQMVLITQLETGILTYEAIVLENPIIMQTYDLLSSAIDLAREFDYRGSKVRVKLDERDRFTAVICHPASLRHALAELVNNAITFSPSEGEVLISQWKAESSIWVSIVDRGVGMSSENLALAFKGFRQIDRERHEQQGMGMGLPLAKGIIEVHGGTLEVNSVVGQGTQVIIRLPLG
jgi:two-component system, sensor histidine kinase and response regulator